ncbi:MAG: 6-phosphogluconolactonase, partial [Rhodothermaceae bacterium]|nr:6-phosphogluconolactonase [Rhodothermaceae bacterium]
QERMVVAAPAPVEPKQRLTMTYPVLNDARTVFFLVSGENKAPALDCVLGNPSSVSVCPSRAIQPNHGQMVWWVDEAAAHTFSKETV